VTEEFEYEIFDNDGTAVARFSTLHTQTKEPVG